MKPRTMRWIGALGLALLVTSSAASASPAYTEDVTDYGRNPSRNHYTPSEPQYPRLNDTEPIWQVPLGLSRSQPLVVKRDYDGNGKPEVHIFHIAGDKLWSLNGDMVPPVRTQAQSVETYRSLLQAQGFIYWNTPAADLCTPTVLNRLGDDLLRQKCDRFRQQVVANPGMVPNRPFASSQAAYWKGSRPSEDVVYVGFGYPASVVAIRPTTGEILGGYIIDAYGDRGIVGAPLVFENDTVVIGTTSGEAYIIKGLASGEASVRGLSIGGRISSSPIPVGDHGFIIASDARWSAADETHGYMMAYSLKTDQLREFTPLWPRAVKTPSGIPGEAAIDDGKVYLADKFGKLYALSLDTGELVWCKQYPSMDDCTEGNSGAPGFINNGPGMDEHNVYFVFRNNEGPNEGGGYVVALRKLDGAKVWESRMDSAGNTAPVPMSDIVLVGDAGGWVRAHNKSTGRPLQGYGGYPLSLATDPYQGGSQGERWWEPISGTATQMTVANGMMLLGVNSTSEDRTLLIAYKLFAKPVEPDLTITVLSAPSPSSPDGFTATVTATCSDCVETVTTSIGLKMDGREVPRKAVTFSANNGWKATVSWHSGPLRPGSTVDLVATVDPANAIRESNENNNTKRAQVQVTVPDSPEPPDDHWGSDLTQ